MTIGIHPANLAHKWLNIIRGTAFTPPPGTWVVLHTGDPGAAGTTTPSLVTTRSAVTFLTAASGALALTGTNPTWTMSGVEVITHISVWDALSGGNFLWSAALAAPKTVAAGDTLTLTTCGLSLGALAA